MCDCGHAGYFARGGRVPRAETSLSVAHGFQPQKADERLHVAAVADQLVELGERESPDLDPLALVALDVDLVDVGGQVEVDLLAREPGRRVATREVLPGARREPDLLAELALRRLERRLALLVELARRELEQCLLVDRLARLRDEEEVLAVVRHDRHRPGVNGDLARRLLAVVVREAVLAHREHPPLPGLLAADSPEGHPSSFARTAPPASAARKNSSSSSTPRPIVRAGRAEVR